MSKKGRLDYQENLSRKRKIYHRYHTLIAARGTWFASLLAGKSGGVRKRLTTLKGNLPIIFSWVNHDCSKVDALGCKREKALRCKKQEQITQFAFNMARGKVRIWGGVVIIFAGNSAQ